MAFSSRSGSTFICREIERRYRVGRVREAFNPNRLNTEGLNLRGGWFAFKAGVHGFIVAEKLGFFDAYLSQTHFLLLYRRDVVAQAVSAVKAKQQGVWHSIAKQAPNVVEYDGGKIGQTVKAIVESMEVLRELIQRTGRPCSVIHYEDCLEDFGTVEAACDRYGAPRHAEPAMVEQVEKLGDEVNEDWVRRFNLDMDSPMRTLIAGYRARLDA